MFSPLSITLIYGEKDAVLVDPPLTIFATHGHGDHWFTGIPAERFGAGVVASAGTIKQMHRNMSIPAAFWDKLFPGQIPPTPVTAVTAEGNRFALEAHELFIVEVGRSDTDDTSVLRVHDLRLVVAGASN